MKKLPFILAFLSSSLFAQQQERCATMPVYYEHLKDAELKQQYAAAESQARAWLKEHRIYGKRNSSIIKIPVVVHVVYKNATQNIADSMIHSQIAVLNECFRKQNANYNTTRPIFDSIGTDVELEFCLASVDPEGNPTSGIVRKQAQNNQNFDPLFNFDKVKKPSFGGDTAWPATKYYNIWVCDMSLFNQTVVLGYATFPGGNPALDGVVIQYNYFGRDAKPNFSGRTTVHETGHWLGLRHIWADDDNGQNPQNVYCDSTDFVDDTPNAGPKSQSNCDKTKNTCTLDAVYWGNLDPPDMVENYMDYSSDNCMTLFTKGQKARMYSFLNSNPVRMALTTSTVGCNLITSVSSQEQFAGFISLSPNPCSTELDVRISAAFDESIELTIYDAAGRLVAREEMTQKSKRISTRGLPSGLYLLRLQSREKVAVKRFVVTD